MVWEDPLWGGCSPSCARRTFHGVGAHPAMLLLLAGALCQGCIPTHAVPISLPDPRSTGIGIEHAMVHPGIEPRSLISLEPAMGRAQAEAGRLALHLI